MADENSYVVRGAAMKCSFGSNHRRINLRESHGSYVNDKPMMNESDYMPVENITYFGICTSPENPNTETLYLFNQMGVPVNGKRCCPDFLEKWVGAKEDAMVDGKPALTRQSQLFCMHGGAIVFVDDGQHSE